METENSILLAELRDAATEIARLRRAIRIHRDARGHDRCWLDDIELYRVLGGEIPGSDPALPPRCEFLERCATYWERRQRPEDRLVLPGGVG